MEITIAKRVSRDCDPILRKLLTEEPAILLEGPRGSGKSTLVRELANANGGLVLDLDDDTVLSSLLQDPYATLSRSKLVVIDEFQRAPSVLSVVKRIVDQDNRAGKFLLAGSVSSGLLPLGTETLTGRVHRLTLPPLSVGEILGDTPRLLPMLLTDQDPPLSQSKLTRQDYFSFIAAGGYPAALARETAGARRRWFTSYLGSVADRDIPQAVEVRHPGALARIYRHIAQQTSTTIARTQLGEQLELAPTTTRAYIDLLVQVHLLQELPGWTVGISAKAARRAKIHVTDTGLAAAAIGADASRLATSQLAGLFMESFILTELMKQRSLVDEAVTFAHYRDRSGIEVDLIIERPDGRCICIEIKSATTTNPADTKSLCFLRERLGDRFQAGILFHTGPLSARVSDRIWAIPVATLWDARSWLDGLGAAGGY